LGGELKLEYLNRTILANSRN